MLGSLLETFVFSELQKSASWHQDRFEFAHFRDKQKNEVDLVIRGQGRPDGGIEVKASATVPAATSPGCANSPKHTRRNL